MKGKKRSYNEMIANNNKTFYNIYNNSQLPSLCLQKLYYKDNNITLELKKLDSKEEDLLNDINLKVIYKNIDANTINIYITKIKDLAKANMPINFLLFQK